MANAVPAKIFGVSLSDNWPNCQIDATYSYTKNMTTPDPCKPNPGETLSSALYNKPEVESIDWELTFSAKVYAEATGFSLHEVTQLVLNNHLPIDVEFKMNDEVTDLDLPYVLVYSGQGILSSQTINAAATGEATYDITITGYGEVTENKIPVATT
jgi:hypothetical protein